MKQVLIFLMSAVGIPTALGAQVKLGNEVLAEHRFALGADFATLAER